MRRVAQTAVLSLLAFFSLGTAHAQQIDGAFGGGTVTAPSASEASGNHVAQSLGLHGEEEASDASCALDVGQRDRLAGREHVEAVDPVLGTSLWQFVGREQGVKHGRIHSGSFFPCGGLGG